MIHRRSPDTDPTPLILRTCEKNSGIHRSWIHGEESEVRGILGEEYKVRGKRGKGKPKRGGKVEKEGYGNGVRKFRNRLIMFSRCPEELALLMYLRGSLGQQT